MGGIAEYPELGIVVGVRFWEGVGEEEGVVLLGEVMLGGGPSFLLMFTMGLLLVPVGNQRP